MKASHAQHHFLHYVCGYCDLVKNFNRDVFKFILLVVTNRVKERSHINTPASI